MNYVYERDYAVLVRLKVPRGRARAPSRSAPRPAGWPAPTRSACPSRASSSLDLPVGSGTPERARFDEWRRALAAAAGDRRPVRAGRRQAARRDPAPGERRGRRALCLSRRPTAPIDYAAKQTFRRDGDTLIAELQRKGAGAQGSSAACSRSATAAGSSSRRCRARFPNGGTPLGGLGAEAILLGGPRRDRRGHAAQPDALRVPDPGVEGAASARAGGGRRRRPGATRWPMRPARSSAPARSGVALLAIRAGGSAAGWAFQLQDPRTILLLLLLATAITLNLLRLFELPVLGRRARSRRAASGPARWPPSSLRPAPGRSSARRWARRCCCRRRVGAGVRGARARPRAPFLLVAFIPALATASCRRPGPWMARLQRFLAIPMAATAVACLWLLWRLGGAETLGRSGRDGWSLRCCWLAPACLQRKGKQTGYVATLSRDRRCRRRGLGASAIARRRRRTRSRAPSRGARRRCSPRSAWADPVFVYFTADWCLTCKANEAAAIDRPGSARRLHEGRACKSSPATGPTATRRSRASSRAAAAPACRFTCGMRPGSGRGAAADPDARNAHFPRSAPALAALPRLSCRRPRSPAPAFGRAPAHRPWSDRGRRG